MCEVSAMTKCPICGKTNFVSMTLQQYERLCLGREHVQTIFPEKSDEERELLISGTCSECWHDLFADDDDDYPFEDDDDDYTPSSTAGDYSPSNPWNAPGMSISDFIF